MSPIGVGLFTAFVVFVALPVSVFLHEAGHAAFGRWAGFTVTSFGLGLGRPWLVVPVRGVRVYLARSHPFQGLTFAFLPRLFPPRLPLVVFAAGGILVNAGLAGLCFAAWAVSDGGGPFWLALAAVNGGLALLCLIPVRARVGQFTLRTDGALILAVLVKGTLSSPAPLTLQVLAALRYFWLAVGDTRILRLYLAAAASACVELGDFGRARELLDEEEYTPGPAPAHLSATLAMLRAHIALSQNPPGDAGPALADAETYFRATDEAGGLVVVESLRVHALLARGETTVTAASEELARLARSANHPELGMALLADRLGVACSGTDGELVRPLHTEFESARLRHPSDTRDLQVYRALAGFSSRSGDFAAADEAHRRVLSSLQNLALGFQAPGERARFLDVQAETLGATRAYLESRGAGGEYDRFLEATGEKAPVVAALERDRRLRRWARNGMLTNTAVAACLFATPLAFPLDDMKACLLLGGTLAVFTLVGIACLFVDLTLGRLIPALKCSGGGVLLALVCYAWLIGLMAIVMALAGHDL